LSASVKFYSLFVIILQPDNQMTAIKKAYRVVSPFKVYGTTQSTTGLPVEVSMMMVYMCK